MNIHLMEMALPENLTSYLLVYLMQHLLPFSFEFLQEILTCP